MLCTIITGIYCFIGGLLAAALLTDKHCNTNRREAVFCLIAGVLWPLAIGVAAGFGLYDNVKEKINVRRQARNEQLMRFAAKLFKMRVISKETMLEIQRRISS